MTPLQAAYEEVFYPSFPRAQSTPDRMAAVATLFGLEPPAVATARVLEIGCSDGGNLLPLAVVSPQANFLGIDFSAAAVARGQRRVVALGLTNLELRELDVMHFPDDAPAFDYVICHGVCSWVPAAVRERIFEILQRHLAPSGVAYVDYNAQPGGQLRYLFREAMRFHVRQFSDPRQRVDQARALLKLIVDSNPAGALYRAVAEAELKRLLRTPEAVVFHDDLAEMNEPLFFHEFAAAAARRGLQFLGEAEVSAMSGLHLPEAARTHLAQMRDVIHREQYLDLIEGRPFRQTLLCRDGARIDRTGNAAALAKLWFSPAASASEPDARGEIAYQSARHTMRTGNRTVHALMHTLGEAAPGRLSWEELCAKTEPPVGGPPAHERLTPVVLHAIASGIVTIHATPAPFTTEVSERPAASALARYQAAEGEAIVTLAHRVLDRREGDKYRRLLPLLDGTRTIEAIAGALATEEDRIRADLAALAAHALLLAT